MSHETAGSSSCLDVPDEVLGRLHLGPHLRVEAHVPDRLQRVHPLVLVRVVLPADAGLLQEVRERLHVDAGADVLPVRVDLVDHVGEVVRVVLLVLHDLLLFRIREAVAEVRRELRRIVAVAARVVGRALVVDDPLRLRGDRVEVFRERRTEHRREEVVGQDEPISVGPVVRDAGSIEVRVARHVLARADDVVAVHRTTVDRVQPRGEPVRDVMGSDVGSLRQFVLRPGCTDAVGAGERSSLRLPFGARIGGEVVVERPVLFHDEDHVLDRAVRPDDADAVPSVAAPVAVAAPGARLPVPSVGARLLAATGRPREPHHADHGHERQHHARASSREICLRVGRRRCGDAGRMMGPVGGCTMVASLSLARWMGAEHPQHPGQPSHRRPVPRIRRPVPQLVGIRCTDRTGHVVQLDRAVRALDVGEVNRPNPLPRRDLHGPRPNPGRRPQARATAHRAAPPRSFARRPAARA